MHPAQQKQGRARLLRIRHSARAVVLLVALAATGPAARAKGEGDAMTDWRQVLDREIQLSGTVSQVPAQHPIASIVGKKAEYIDLDDGDQIVAYVPMSFSCRTGVRLWGTVLRQEASHKRPGRQHQIIVTYQFDVKRFECVAGAARVTALLERLVDSAAAADRREATEESIVRLGSEAIPVLIEHLNDPRPVEVVRRVVNENLLINAPAHVPAPAPDYRDVTITLGQRCNALLQRIITPPGYQSPFATNAKPFHTGPDVYYFRVKDWRAWWARNRATPLSTIRDSLRPVIDRFWKQHGVEQELR